MSRLKVIHMPTSVGGMSWGLAQGERALGLLSDVLVLVDGWLHYPADRFIFRNTPKSILGKIWSATILIKEVYKMRKNYDVFHFNFGSSLIDIKRVGLHLMDLPFYKGKIVVTYNGCDARQKYPTIQRVPFSACHNEDCYQRICNDGIRDGMKRLRIAKFDQYADTIFALNPDLLYFLPARSRFLPYTITDWAKIETQPSRLFDRKLRIVHSPTNRMAKGSDVIIQTLELMKRHYGDYLEMMIVENLPYRKAREVYAKADLAIDQILIGWYGGFAVEMMKMGKPVMAFIREEDLKFLPKEMADDCQEALIQVEPVSLYERLCELIENPHLLVKYREAGLEYVHKWHDPVYVAGITKSIYES